MGRYILTLERLANAMFYCNMTCLVFIQVEMTGLTGTIKFDQHGLRTDFTLEIVELKKDGLVKVGVWMEKTGCNFTRNFTEDYKEIEDSLQNKTLIVTTVFVRICIINFQYELLIIIIK